MESTTIFISPSTTTPSPPLLEPLQRVQPTLIIDPNLQMPYVLSSYFGVQHSLTSSLVLESAYVGNRGVKFPINRTYNFPDRVTGVRPNPQMSQGYYLDNSATSWYHSWQTSLRKRFSKESELCGPLHLGQATRHR